jgi:undecaprenyl diphosphate synthase
MIEHVALIPDGNRRWARKKGFFPWQGHIEGAKTLEKILEKAWELKIPYFTFWGSSLDNILKRSPKEVKTLFSLYEKYFKKLLREKRISEEKVKISVFGKWKKLFPEKLKKIISQVVLRTKKHNQYFLTFLLAYNGTDEMLEAIKKISKKKIKKITEKVLLENLWTGFLPPVDLIIRTGCEKDPHNSAGFMMWQTAYSQFYFAETYFPDFSPKEFERAIKEFERRERRLGR